MPSIRSADEPLATRDDIQRFERQLAEIRATLKQVEHDQQIQFTRIAQLQADMDVIRSAWAKIESPISSDKQYSGPERRKTARKRR